jgi:hypothetical protein
LTLEGSDIRVPQYQSLWKAGIPLKIRAFL